MRKSTLTMTLVFMMIISVFAQSPQAFKHQAVVRDATGEIMSNQSVSFQINIRDGSAGGTVIYQETHNLITNQFGIAIMEIGNGTQAVGTFTNINWGSNSKFMELELDPTGGTNYLLLGTTQMMSVPYALYSETSGDSFNLPYADSASTSEPVIKIINKGSGSAIYGRHNQDHCGILGATVDDTQYGVYGISKSGSAGVFGKQEGFEIGVGVLGESDNGGVKGRDGLGNFGVLGGKFYLPYTTYGAYGFNTHGTYGLLGAFYDGYSYGVYGEGTAGAAGVLGDHGGMGHGVWGKSVDGNGVYGESDEGTGVYGAGKNIGVYGTASQGHAGYFEGDVHIQNNLGVGTLSPSSELEVNGTVTASAFVGDGSGLTGLPLDNDWGKSGNYVFTLNDSVGIGSNSLLEKFHLHGSIFLEKLNPVIRLHQILGSGSSQPKIIFENTNRLVVIGEDDEDEIVGLYSKFKKDRDYDAKLQVFGKSVDTWGNYIEVRHDGTDGRISTDVGDILLMPNANVGIGTSTPATKLELSDSEDAWFRISADNDNSGGDDGTQNAYLQFTTDMGSESYDGLIWLENLSGDTKLHFDVEDQETMVMHDGKIGLGTSTPASKLTNSSTLASDGIKSTEPSGINWRMSGSGYALGIENLSGGGSGLLVEAGNNAGTGATVAHFVSNDVSLMLIAENGNVGIGTTTPSQRFEIFNGSTTGTYTTSGWQHSSDARLKTNIAQIDNSLKKVMDMEGVYFDWKNKEEKHQVGVIAQEMEKVLPEVVNQDDQGFYSVSYGGVVPVLIEAIKEQQAIINSMQTQNEDLNERLDKLEKIIQQ